MFPSISLQVRGHPRPGTMFALAAATLALSGCASTPAAPGEASKAVVASTASGPATAPATAPAAAPATAPAAAPAAASQAAVQPGQPRPFADVIKDAKDTAGLFRTWQKEEKVWLEIAPEQFDHPFFLSVNLTRGLGEHNVYGGMMLMSHVTYFKRIGNQVQLLFDGPTTAINMAMAGRVKMLGVTDKKRYAVLPDVPTMAEAGVPGLDMEGGMMFYAPAKTPPDIIKRLNEELAKALKDPAVVTLYVNGGTEIVASSPEELAAMNRRGYDNWGALIKKLDIKLD